MIGPGSFTEALLHKKKKNEMNINFQQHSTAALNAYLLR